MSEESMIMTKNDSRSYGLYFLVLVLVGVGAALLVLPAALFLESKLFKDTTEVEFQRTEGTFVTGSTKIEMNGLVGNTRWDIDLYELLSLNAVADVGIDSEYGHLSGDIKLNSSDAYIRRLSGELSADGFNKLIRKFGGNATIYSGFQIKDLDIRRKEDYFLYATGRLNWQGGKITLKDGNEILLPAMVGRFDRYDEGIRLRVVQKDDGLPLGEVDITHSGTAHFKFLERFGNYIPMIPRKFMNGNPDAVMFQIRQEVFEQETVAEENPEESTTINLNRYGKQ